MVTDYQNELLPLLPKKPSDDYSEWLCKKHKITANAIVYKVGNVNNPLTGQWDKMAQCTCTACNTTFYQPLTEAAGCTHAYGQYGFYTDNNEAVSSGDDILCPNCNAQVRLYHSSVVSTYGTVINSYVGAELIKIDGNIIIISWLSRRVLSKDGTCRDLITPYEAYAFVDKKCLKYVGWYKCFNSVKYMTKWESKAQCSDTLSSVIAKSDLRPFRAAVLKNTKFENAKIKKYITDSNNDRCFAVTYLRTYQTHPQTENLIMQGCTKIFNEIIYEGSLSGYSCDRMKVPTHGIYWRTKKPAEMFGLNKPDFKKMLAEAWTYDELKLYRAGLMHAMRIDIRQIRDSHMSIYTAQKIVKHGIEPAAVLRYIYRQINKYGYDSMLNPQTLIDTWELARDCNIELNAKSDYFPQNLLGEHNKYMQVLEQRREERRIAHAAEQAKKQKQNAKNKVAPFKKLALLYKQFAFECDGLCIRIASDPMELIDEGYKLRHCVGSYISIHAHGHCCIFFVRKVSAPDEQYYTLELNMDTLEVMQNRGKYNCARTPEVQKFEKMWLEYIKNIKQSKGA